MKKDSKIQWIILGLPGGGKTFFCQYWTLSLSQKDINRKKYIPVFVKLIEWQSWWLYKKNSSLIEFLQDFYKDSVDQKKWQKSIDRMFFFFDGVDETNENFQKECLIESIDNKLKDSNFIITSRTLNYIGLVGLKNSPKVFLLDELSEQQQESYIKFFFGNDKSIADSLIAQLSASLKIKRLAKNPLILSIISYLAQIPGKTRSEFYNAAVKKFLEKIKETAYPTGFSLNISDKFDILGYTALYLFMFFQNTNYFSNDDLKDAIRFSLNTCGYNTWEEFITALRDDFIKSGIFQSETKIDIDAERYSFFHPTFHEYLTSYALVRTINRNGWDAKFSWKKNGKQKWSTVSSLISQKAWDTKWQEIIIMLAGSLKEPGLLLSLLTEMEKDDVLRHRFSLAAMCLPEIKEENRNQVPMVDDITDELWNLWLDFQKENLEMMITHIERIFPSLAEVNGKICTQIHGLPQKISLLDYLEEELRQDFIKASKPLLKMGKTAIKPAILEIIFDKLNNSSDEIQYNALKILENMGDAVLNDQYQRIDAIISLLNGKNKRIQLKASDILESFAKVNPKVFDRLLKALKEQDWNIRYHAAEILSRLKKYPKIEEILEEELKRLNNNDRDIKINILAALICLKDIKDVIGVAIYKDFMKDLSEEIDHVRTEPGRIETFGEMIERPKISNLFKSMLFDKTTIEILKMVGYQNFILQEETRLETCSKKITFDIFKTLIEKLKAHEKENRELQYDIADLIGSLLHRKAMIQISPEETAEIVNFLQRFFKEYRANMNILKKFSYLISYLENLGMQVFVEKGHYIIKSKNELMALKESEIL